MVFNHYAKLKRIIISLQAGWYIRRINEPTVTIKFNGEKTRYAYYYRIYDATGQGVPYGKFQKLDKLASVLGCDSSDLPVIE